MIERPRVILDCTAIPRNHGGVGRYISGLLQSLDPTEVDLTIVVQQRDRESLGGLAPWASLYSISPLYLRRPLRFLWEQIRLPALARRAHADVIHSPHYTFPLLWRGDRVVTVHDATFFSEPQAHDPVKRRFFRMWTRLAWRYADVVITPSATTASEVERLIGPPKTRVSVAHLGVDSARFHRPSHDQLAQFRQDHELADGAPWFAFLGTIEPRKNVSAMLDAYAQLRVEFGERTPRLLISGGRGWDTAAIAKLDSLGEGSGVHELGYLPMESLPALLGGAVAVLYPSLGEGFGLPVLEAMACGATVITTDRLALSEVGGDAVVYTGIDSASIATAMRETMLDEPERGRISARALVRAASFTWESTALVHAEAYHEGLRIELAE